MAAEMLELTRAPFVFSGAEAEICARLMVLEGSVQLLTDGMGQTLEAGACAYMETRMPTSLSAVGGKRCRILMVKPATATPTAS